MSYGSLPRAWSVAIGRRSFGACELSQLQDGLDDLSLGRPGGGPTFVAPDRDLIFRAFHLTAPNKVRVVVLGQDPYPQEHPDPNPPRGSVADGLAFSSAGLWPQTSLAPLLWNLRQSGLQTQVPCGADLECWAKEGILLMNESLVYVDGPVDEAFRVLLRVFTRAVLAHCVALAEKPAFIVLGARAWKTAEPLLGKLPPEQVIRTRHPSRLPWPGPSDPSKPFEVANAYLGPRAVDWDFP